MKYAFQIGEKTAEVNCHDNLTIEELEVAKEMLSKMIDTRIITVNYPRLKSQACREMIDDYLAATCSDKAYSFRTPQSTEMAVRHLGSFYSGELPCQRET